MSGLKPKDLLEERALLELLGDGRGLGRHEDRADLAGWAMRVRRGSTGDRFTIEPVSVGISPAEVERQGRSWSAAPGVVGHKTR